MAWDRNKTEQELFEENEYLVKQIAKRLAEKSKLDFDDLYQEGAIGLLYAIRYFLKGKPVRISHERYAVMQISHAMKRFSFYQEPTLHVSRRSQASAYKANKEKEKEIIKQATAISVMEAGVMDALDSQNSKDVTREVEEDALFRIQIREVLKVVERLPDSRKIIMREYFKNGMDVKATAEAVGCHISTVYRARDMLREKVRNLKIFDKDAT